jgi:hypothetical protein
MTGRLEQQASRDPGRHKCALDCAAPGDSLSHFRTSCSNFREKHSKVFVCCRCCLIPSTLVGSVRSRIKILPLPNEATKSHNRLRVGACGVTRTAVTACVFSSYVRQARAEGPCHNCERRLTPGAMQVQCNRHKMLAALKSQYRSMTCGVCKCGCEVALTKPKAMMRGRSQRISNEEGQQRDK